MMHKNSSNVEKIRKFNRFFTKQFGFLKEHTYSASLSLTEARVLWELANRDAPTTTELSRELEMDAGQLSRIITGFQKKGLLSKKRDESDRRNVHLGLTSKGRKEFEIINSASESQIKDLLDTLLPSEQRRLIGAMHLIERLLTRDREEINSYLIRQPQAGDYGWVIQFNGELYKKEYGWDETYEGLVAEIVADFIKNFDPVRERCWIAEKNGENVGSVFLVKRDQETAKLRLLIVDPKARGLGIGRRLVNECTRFARSAGYKKITLWTQSTLLAARHIYTKEGYKLINSEPHNSFGHDLVAETWELDLESIEDQ
ncbi:helix-turn-helix domain-containing GNAT family N-acetyltransferase [Leptolyngbya sp. 7M]|uniref:bifunctional helix-turn-helix transcriptional regulator/GNAT family N-acetyltransferase n=1 Tax=Leptolyngbya sp. 7M TaxID=2812896 RepID=UPI001B8AB7B7|nr:helix-turn-helix domain-containing GNAT family N-acetyltransferase [Leptolyngbya sp. 7M]QYO65993.1 GNAT family N-acetyltransferase [Leptolyngbya sp. 7M]